MTFKELFGLTVVPLMMLSSIVAACGFKRLRDVFFILLVFLAPMIERVDVNFVSREWYRGTSRGFEVSLLDVLAIGLLVSALVAPRRGESRGFWPACFGVMLLFFAYCCFNVAVADPRIFGCFGLFEMLRGCIVMLAVAFYLRTERELRIFLLTLGLLVCYEGLLALRQRYWLGVHRVPGTIDDSNSLSVFLCLTAPIFVAVLNSRLPVGYKLLAVAAIPLACVAEIMTISRAGVVIMGLVLFGTAVTTMSIHLTPRKVIIALVVAIGVSAVLAKSWKTLESRFKETNLEEEYHNKRKLGRGYYIRIARAMATDRPFGVGLNNWSYWASDHYGPLLGYQFVPYRGTELEPTTLIPDSSNVDEAQAAPAHSLGALTTGELGYPGLVIFVLVWLRWLQIGATFLWRRRRDPMVRIGVGLFFGFCGLFLQSLTEWVFWQAPIFYTFNIVLGVLVSLHHKKRKSIIAERVGSLELDPEMVPSESIETGANA